MTPEEKIKQMLGDAMFQIVLLQSRVEELEKQLAEKKIDG